MERRRCGKSDLELPVLGVGCWSFGGGSYWGPQEQPRVDAVVARAVELGSDYFDTAESYNDGASEESLGRALKGKRDRAIIGTKVSPSNCGRGVLREHCERSLRRLGTDFIDLYMVHWPVHPHAIRHYTDDESVINNPASVADVFAALVDLQEAGKIRHIGVSNFGVRWMERALATGARIAANELPYSLLSRAIELEILPYCREHGIGVLAYMPLMQGLLTGKYASADEMPAARTRTRHFSGDRPQSRHGEPGAEKELFEALDGIRRIAGSLGVSMTELALAWCVANPAITCVLAGARNVAQLEANAGAMSGKLAPETVEELDAATKALKEKLGPSFDYFENTELDRTR